MNAQVREAAERLRAAKEWLSANPPDDDTPYDAAWLESVGFERDPDQDYMRLLTVDDPYPTYLTSCVLEDPFNGYQACITEYETLADANKFDRDDFSIISAPNSIRTRGDIRRLVAALGCKLKETP